MSEHRLALDRVSNPRVISALFTAGLLLAHAGNVAANGAGGINGP